MEMVNAESKSTKGFVLSNMRTSRVYVGKYCHDCACVVGSHFEEILCARCYLDGYHTEGHKCGTCSLKDHAVLNSQAAERLWSRLDKSAFISGMPHARYRCIWFNYCKWRNEHLQNKCYANDISPLMSSTKLKKHGRK